MLGKVHQLFWLAYYFFYNLLNDEKTSDDNADKKRDAACSTPDDQPINTNWHTRTAQSIPHPWKLIIIRRQGFKALQKPESHLKFMPLRLWEKNEPDFWKQIALLTWILGADAAIQTKAHKTTQSTRIETEEKIIMTEQQQQQPENDTNDEMTIEDEGEKIEAVNDENVEGVDEAGKEDEKTIVESPDLSEIKESEVENEPCQENHESEAVLENETASAQPDEEAEDATAAIPSLNEDDKAENKQTTAPEIIIEESDEVTVEIVDDENGNENEDEEKTTEKEEHANAAIDGTPVNERNKDKKVTGTPENDTNGESDDVKTTTGEKEGDKQFDSKAVQTNFEEPISFYVRRVSLSSRSGENTPKTIYSPPPVAPPAPHGSGRVIPVEIKPANEPESPVKGGVSVFVPGLANAAKESVQRRLRMQSQSPDVTRRNVNIIQRPAAATEPLNQRSWRTEQVVTKINTPQAPLDSPNQTQYFLFHPKSHIVHKTASSSSVPVPWNDLSHRQERDRQDHSRMYSTSPTPSGNFLLGKSVFEPVNEVERIRNDFNSRSESRARSTSYSRPTSVMSQSYHEGNYDNNKSLFPENGASSNVHYTATAMTTPWPSHRWALREDIGPSNSEVCRYPVGVTSKVFERKVTERHVERDVDGQMLNGWRQQDWNGTYQQFQNPPPDHTPLL